MTYHSKIDNNRIKLQEGSLESENGEAADTDITLLLGIQSERLVYRTD